MTLLQAKDLTIGYSHLSIAGPLDAEIHAGQMICLLGPNGAGKSTLLRTLVGLQHPLEGTVLMTGDLDVSHATPAQLAKRVSLVLTDSVRNSDMTVYALIALGRYPYSNWLGLLTDTDRAMIASAIDATDLGELTARKVSSLSDGECQKVMLARALAQDTPLMMLDEPTAHLDLPSRIQLMQLLHRLAKQTGKGILVSTHELDLALQVADEVWLLQKKTTGLYKGTPEDLVLSGTFQSAFEKEGILFDNATGAFRIQREEGARVVLKDEGVGGAILLWTQKALQRKGVSVSMPGADAQTGVMPDLKDTDPPLCAIRLPRSTRPTWVLEHEGHTQELYSIAALLAALDHINPSR